MQDTILVVEDSASAAESLKRRLQRELGFKVVIAADKVEAQHIMAGQRERLFLAVLDLHLPDAPQGEILKVAETHGVPAVVYTGVPELTGCKGLTGRAIDYVLKGRRAEDQLVSIVGRLRKNLSAEVLVVDDSASSRGHIRYLLSRYMFTVLEATNGEQALEVLTQHPGVRLVVTDYEMPRMNGVELVRRIREVYPPERMGIIGISARSNRDLSVRFLKQGANDFLHKPFEREELYVRAANTLEAVERTVRLNELNELKNRFLSMAAHDLRGPIGSIKGFAAMLMEEFGDEHEEWYEMAEVMEQGAGHVLELVQDMLDVSIIESGRMKLDLKRSDLGELVRSRLTPAKLAASHKKMELRFVESVPVSCVFDPVRLGQVVDNLLSNAVKFSPPGSRVTIRVERDGTGRGVLEISDQGPGLSADELERAFTPFQRLSAKPTGGEASTGLGLSIVKAIVSAHGGEVRVQSDKGRGAVFTVYLPSA